MERVGPALVIVLLALSACPAPDVQTPTQADRVQDEMAQLEHRLFEARAERRRLENQLQDLQPPPERPGREVLVSLPLIGELKWDCDDRRRFVFIFKPSSASIRAEYVLDSERGWANVDPGEVLSTPYFKAGAHHEWQLRYDHEPATISAGVAVVPKIKHGECFVRNFTLEQTRSR